MRRLLLVATCLLALSACRLDVTVDVAMEPDGTGLVTVEAVADAELVTRQPDLADDLHLDDAVANGWELGGPAATADGGLRLTLTHEFRSAAELANVLTSIGPPLTDMAAARTPADDDQTTNAIDGELRLDGGFAGFADADLLALVGGAPFGDELAGLSPADVMSFTYRVKLPGELVSAETGVEQDDGSIVWTAPLDGSSLDVLVQTVQRPAGGGSGWATPVAWIALIALIVWVLLSVAFIAYVIAARRRRARRRARPRPDHPSFMSR